MPWKMIEQKLTIWLADHPEIVEELSGLWTIWAKSHMVYPLNGRDWDTRLLNPVYFNQHGEVLENQN